MKTKSPRTSLGDLLRTLATFVDENPDLPVHSSLANFDQVPKSTKARPVARKSRQKPSTVDVEAVIEHIRSAVSRDQGHGRIDVAGLTRVDLEAICRSQGLPVQKGDSVELLKDRIVEHLIGSRLRSDAIRNSTSGFKGEK